MWGSRLLSILGLAVRRVRGRVRTTPLRVLASVLGVALAIALMVAVTGISLGLASQSVVDGDDVDYWVLPEDATVQSVAVSTEGLQLGDVHATSERIGADSRVEAAIPVLLELLPVRDGETGQRRYLLAAGVRAVPDASVLGLSLAPLTAGDPYYANGSYNGTWTGEVVLNEAAAVVTNASAGSQLRIDRPGSTPPLTVRNVSAGEAQTGVGAAPVALVHLSELQSLTGATAGDQADQILVVTDDRAVKDRLERIYPQTTVVTRSGLAAQQLSPSNLPLAVAVAALVVAVVIGILFVTTLMGLDVSANRQQLGTMAALGLSRRSRALLIGAETVCLSLCGGVLGVCLGALAIVGVNAFGAAALGSQTVALFDPLLIGYTLLVTLVIGLVGAIYPVVLSRRVGIEEALR